MSSKVWKGSLAGSLLAAFMASACCLGPLIFSVLGLTSAGYLVKFEEYRIEFIVVALLLLGVAGFFTFRKKPVEDCAPDSRCANPRAKRINKVVFWIAAALTTFMIVYPMILERLSA